MTAVEAGDARVASVAGIAVSSKASTQRFAKSSRTLAIAVWLISAQTGTTPPANAATATGAVLEQYCRACHNNQISSGGLDLARLDPAYPGADPDAWEAVVRKLLHRHMPPPGMPRPDEATYDAVVGDLEHRLDSHAAANLNPGRESAFRRLNRTEYRNAVRDLLGLEVDVESLLPRDETGHGFDNVTGEFSPTLLERYLAAARKISRLAIGTPPTAPGGELVLIPVDRTQESQFRELPFGTRGGALIPHLFPTNGEYEIHITLSRDRNEHVEGLYVPHEVELMLDGRQVRRFVVEPAEGRDHTGVDKHLFARIPVSAGRHEIGATFLKKSSALIETERQPYLARFNMDRHPRTQPAVYSVSIVGPYAPATKGETESRRRVFSCRPSPGADEGICALRILERLARRAYRRPPTARELDDLLAFYRQGLERGGFEDGIETALRALLVSPHFLFRAERPATHGRDEPYQVSDYELASRLSFLLWSSIPDDELLEVAGNGRLRDDAVLESQVRRMLADHRSRALVENFAGMWLYLRNLDSWTPDRRLFADFDDNLRQSFRLETELLIEAIVHEDRSLVELLSADFTFLNERLAKHYGIPHIYGDHFRRVNLPADGIRGGLLTHGSILAVTSYGNRTSPVLRGKWVLENILGTPPPPPPPEATPLRERSASDAVLTLRERISEHRADPACASCHDIIDPIGFAFENFDAVGRWRTHDEGVPVDASGTLPDGTRFNGPNGFLQALLRRPELFVSTATEKLLTYALGRGLESYDAPAVRKIVRDAERDDYQFSSLMLGVVRSAPFQMRRPQ
ncbi:MAG: DUF1592 domain-containing protein [Bryobacterales bacterium]|nr:DUF1592 domain-containing protein [Bryobacterales bacterium]